MHVPFTFHRSTLAALPLLQYSCAHESSSTSREQPQQRTYMLEPSLGSFTTGSLVRQRSVGEDEGGAAESRGSGTKPRYAKVRRTGRACDACAKVKMRCNTGSDNSLPCQRCSRQGYECTFHNADARQQGRGKQPANTTDSSKSASSSSTSISERQ